MAALAFGCGVDFRHADPDGRDWNLHLLLALRAQVLADERAAAAESDRQLLALTGRFAAMAGQGRRELLGGWEKSLDRLTATLLGVEAEAEAAGPSRGSVEALKAQYVARFGDPLDPAFVAYDRAVADWILRGGDLKGEPPPARPGGTTDG